MERSTTIASTLTIDLIFLVLSRSIFHPFIAWLIPLSLQAAGFPASHPHVIYTTYYAGIVSVVALYQLLDFRLAYGQPRKVNWTDEVVVITGGASGLGKILVETLGMRGVSVAVLDIHKPADSELQENEALGSESVQWYLCDVSSRIEVVKISKQIVKDLGEPTILINNAGVVHGQPLLSLSSKQIDTTLDVNLRAHFNTLQVFLPAILKTSNGGAVVTIASVLGKLGAAYLSDYTASKAGLIALHKSLAAELNTVYKKQGGDRVQTVLVTPGQLATKLFDGLETPSAFFGPVVEPVVLAREVIRKLDTGTSGEISLPLYARFISILEILPPGLQLLARWVSGVDTAMAGMQSKRAGKAS